MLNEQFQKDLLSTKLNVQEAKFKSDKELAGNVYFTTHTTLALFYDTIRSKYYAVT